MSRMKLKVLYLVTLIAVVFTVEYLSSVVSISKEIKTLVIGIYVFAGGIAVWYRLKTKEKETKEEKNAK
jgi:hypothetical protein